MSTKYKIASISSEIAPFSKSGGLGDVARSLPKAIRRLGHEVVCITPLYGKAVDKKKHKLKLIHKNIKVRLNAQDFVLVNFWQGYMMDGLPVYFMENRKYFSRRKKLYGSRHENLRWMIFDMAALKLLSLIKFEADIIHCHDWQTGLIPYFLKNNFRRSETLKKAKTVFTIHNLVFQMGHDWWDVPFEKKDYGRSPIPAIDDPDLEHINFIKRAVLTADAISTVSEQYREEIMTRKFGQDMHRILKNREDRLFGIVNGIDYKAYNPQNDPGLYINYTHKKIHRKKLNKAHVQKLFGLPIDMNVPVICTTSRVVFQKGFELILEIVEPLLRFNIQLIVIGAGDKHYVKELLKIARKYPKKMVVVPSHEMNQKYETLIYSGADFFMLPSHHEPCGINQLIAMRYGCIPIVRKVGGLLDTVEDFDPGTGTGTGFSFERFDKFSLYGAVVRALENFKNKKVFREIMVRAMQQSNSWLIPASKYVTLYEEIMDK